MRNKNVFYIIIGIALILIISVGYALFSETIAIKGTAKAEGTFIVNGYCNKGLPTSIATKLGAANIETEGGYTNDTCAPAVGTAGKDISMSVNFNYPGAKRYFVVKMANEGTIDAELNMETGMTLSGLSCVDMNKDGTIVEQLNSENDNGECFELTYASQVAFEAVNFLFEKNDNNHTLVAEDDADFTEFMDEETGIIILEPNESMYILFLAEFQDYVQGSGTYLAKSTLNASFKFDQPTVSNS